MKILKIKNLIDSSRKVFKDVALENGAIVAANTDKPYYPRQASDYRKVWPRDAAYICVAADILKLPIQEPFFRWLEIRPEDFKKEGLLYQSYSTNGRLHGHQFQPDQAGTILWAIHEYFKDDFHRALKYEVLIRRLADGLVDNWKETHFFTNTVDLWEEEHRKTSTAYENNHTYSLAACARGLFCADAIIPSERWKKTASQMMKKIEKAYNKKKGYFFRTAGRLSDENIDASLLGLVYPFEIVKAKDERMVNTVKKIEKELCDEGGLHRYQFDYYDGDGTACEGGGTWPLLNFWMAIYWAIYGNKNKALKYYSWVVDKVDEFIPEQIFKDERKGVIPLAWSHAMFIIASKFLGFIK